jgi:hypothetical protein
MDDPLYSALKKIRERPDRYLNEKSLMYLIHFLKGYTHRVWDFDPNYHDCLPGRDSIYGAEFNEFVNSHLFEEFKISGGEIIDAWPEEGFTEYVLFGANRHWGDMISDHSSSEAAAFDKFYELLDEFVQAEENKSDNEFFPSSKRELQRIEPFYSILKGDMRKRPGLYLHKKSLVYLYHLIAGYQCRAVELEPNYQDCFSGTEFDEFVHLHYRGRGIPRTKSWLTMIAENSPSEAAAFDKFYELFDEFLEEHKDRRKTE